MVENSVAQSGQSAIEDTIESIETESKPRAKRSSRKAKILEDEQPTQPAEAGEIKVSWRDKMKAKMAENADNYENLDSVLEKKNKN